MQYTKKTKLTMRKQDKILDLIDKARCLLLDNTEPGEIEPQKAVQDLNTAFWTIQHLKIDD